MPAYFFPNEAASFQSLSEQAGKSQLYAGLQFPTDYYAGMDLGKKVAARVIEVAKLDGSDAVWTGTVPTGKCMWVGANPANVTATTWKPFLLSSPSEFGLRRRPLAIGTDGGGGRRCEELPALARGICDQSTGHTGRVPKDSIPGPMLTPVNGCSRTSWTKRAPVGASVCLDRGFAFWRLHRQPGWKIR